MSSLDVSEELYDQVAEFDANLVIRQTTVSGPVHLLGEIKDKPDVIQAFENSVTIRGSNAVGNRRLWEQVVRVLQ